MNLKEIQDLHLELSTHCNAKCPHCPRFNQTIHDIYESSGTLHPDLKLGHMEFSVIEKQLQIDQMSNLKKVVLQGDKGDPCMNPDIEKFVDFFINHKNKPRVVIITNGSIRSADWWSKLAKKYQNNFRVTFSIDGLADTNHLYRVGVNFQSVMNNAMAFVNNGGMLKWKFMVFRHNQHQIETAKKLSQEIGFYEFVAVQPDLTRFKDLPAWSIKLDNGTSYTIEPPDDINFSSANYSREHSVVDNTLINEEQICPYLRAGSLYVTATYKVVPCCMMHFDTELEYPGRDQLKLLAENFDHIDLSINNLESILDRGFYKRNLNNSFKNDKWHSTCAKSCKSDIIKNLKKVENSVDY